MRFDSLTADAHAVRQLEQCIAAPENILLTGARGTAKKDILRVLARKMLCRGDKSEACTCASCARMLDYHPDFKMIVPEGNIIKREYIDGIMESVREVPQMADVKVYLIAGAQYMNDSAANALLKAMEDRGRNVFLLAADGDVINTIASRCRIIRLKALLPKVDLGAEREMIELTCEGRIEYVQEFKKNNFFKKLVELRKLLYSMNTKAELMDFFDEFREKADSFYLTSTVYERDAALGLMSKVFYWSFLEKMGVVLPGVAGSEALARLYSEQDMQRIVGAIDTAYRDHGSQKYNKNDWFSLMVELTK